MMVSAEIAQPVATLAPQQTLAQLVELMPFSLDQALVSATTVSTRTPTAFARLVMLAASLVMDLPIALACLADQANYSSPVSAIAVTEDLETPVHANFAIQAALLVLMPTPA